jgi:hypothetical protein
MNKQQIIEQNKLIDIRSNGIKGNRIGILGLFHYNDGIETIRIIADKDDMIEASKYFTRDSALNAIMSLVKKGCLDKNGIANENLSKTIAAYYPHTNSYQINSLMNKDEEGIVINFYCDNKVPSRPNFKGVGQIYSMDFESWRSYSTETQANTMPYTVKAFNAGDIKLNSVKTIIPKGLKEFIYGDKSIFAINKNNADRKATQLGLI